MQTHKLEKELLKERPHLKVRKTCQKEGKNIMCEKKSIFQKNWASFFLRDRGKNV
jgi:hypothetical protein